MDPKSNSEKNSYRFSDTITRLTALWAFSEAAFGGILHALKIPFTGLFVGGAAVIFISLIAYHSEKSTTILRSTMFVILIKFIVTPYTPINAYFSIFVEAILGTILFSVIKHHHIASLLLGISSLTFSAFQKLLVITILFGNTLWESIDIFSNYIINIFTSNTVSIAMSYFFISVYVLIHAAGGVIFGIIASKIPNWIDNFSEEVKLDDIIPEEELKQNRSKRKRRSWLQKRSGILIITMSIILVLISYFNDHFETNVALNLLIMFIRSIIITVLWFLVISPIATKILQKYLNRKRSSYSEEVNDIVEMLPYMKGIVIYSWKRSKEFSGIQQIKIFFSYLFVIILKN
ncbi:MAG: hypothetical protein ABFS12_06745 [Bacteroidota bacterium]